MRLLAVTVLTAVVLSGCASTHSTASGRPGGTGSPPGGTASSPGGTGSPVDARCPAQLDEGQYNGRQATPVSGDIDVDWVLRCTVAPQPDGHRYLLTERSDSDPAALLAALRTPDEPPSGGACPMIRMVVPYFALVRRDGRALAPKVPLTDCRQPQPAVLQALNGMHFEVVSRRQLP
jgi:hypothetical protein